jgi:hypothetical protein
MLFDTTASAGSPGTESTDTGLPVAASPPEGSPPAGIAGSMMPDGPNQGVIEDARRRRSRHGRLGVSVPTEPTLDPLDAQGRRIAQRVRRQPVASVAPLAPGDAGRPPCTLRAQGLAGSVAQWSHVAGAVRPYPGALVGRAYVSCVDVEYSLDHWPLDAAILLDAAHPGARPAAIPGLNSVVGEPAYSNGKGDFKGEVTATRVPHAWLVVAGGRSMGQRIALLRHLVATVALPTG